MVQKARVSLRRPLVSPLLAAVAVSGCGEPLRPIARIELTPAYLCESAPDQTVRLDATGSRAWDGGPPDGHAYHWTFSDGPVDITAGGTTEPRVTAVFDATRPVRIHLRVTDPDGVSAEQVETLGVTRTRLPSCADGCLAHEVCAAVAGQPACVDEGSCAGPDDCAPCLRCAPDDGGVPRCIP